MRRHPMGAFQVIRVEYLGARLGGGPFLSFGRHPAPKSGLTRGGCIFRISKFVVAQ
jgi:hypothetical protein